MPLQARAGCAGTPGFGGPGLQGGVCEPSEELCTFRGSIVFISPKMSQIQTLQPYLALAPGPCPIQGAQGAGRIKKISLCCLGLPNCCGADGLRALPKRSECLA